MMGWFGRGAGRGRELRTARLRLVSITPAMMKAEALADGAKAKLAKLLNAHVTAEWPPEHWEPHVFEIITEQLVEEPETAGWHRYVLLRGERGGGATLIGCVGGFPRPEGDVEIGYSTLPEFQRRGFATEAVTALVEWLLGREGVRSVSAQTFSRLPESIKVMERCGMTPAGSGDEEGTICYRRMR